MLGTAGVRPAARGRRGQASSRLRIALVLRAAPTDTGALVFDSEFLRKLERIELLARKVFRGQVRGEHSTQRRGHGLEFTDFRRYQAGDDFRYIDWNIFSRLDRLVLKLYTAEEDVTLYLLVDASASMGFGTPLKFDYARRLTAALAYIGLNNLDRVVLHCFGDDLGAGLGPLRTRRHLTTVLDFLTAQTCHGPSAFTTALREFAVRARGPGLVVVVSDLLGTRDLQPGLDALRRRGHDVVLLQVLAEDEVEPGLDGVLRLIDAEDDSELKVTVDAELRELYQRRLRDWLQAFEACCLKTGVEYLRSSTAIDFEDLLLRYLRQGRHLR